MKGTANNDLGIEQNPVSLRIWDDILHSMEKYTNDSYYSMFFQPEELIAECRTMAASFTLLHYNPIPTMKEIYRSRLYGLFFFTTVCGVQIFLKEYSLFNNNAPYRLQDDRQTIRILRNHVLRHLTEGAEISGSIHHVMALFLAYLNPVTEKLTKNSKNGSFNEALFEKFLPITVVWGYLFAQEMVREY